jgi:hypothetical protein
MPYQPNYPATVAECIRPRRKYKPEVLRAVKVFRRSKPWRGSLRARLRKFAKLNRALARAYGIPVPGLRVASGIEECFGRANCYVPRLHLIIMGRKLSVVTYLHEFGHALGKDERQTCVWSINLFARLFRRSFARCEHQGHMLVRRPLDRTEVEAERSVS